MNFYLCLESADLVPLGLPCLFFRNSSGMGTSGGFARLPPPQKIRNPGSTSQKKQPVAARSELDDGDREGRPHPLDPADTI